MRWRGIWLAVLLELSFTVGPGLLMSPAMADDYPYQSQPFVMDGAVTQVDIDRDRVILKGDNGRQYTLDTSQSEITLLDGNRAGLTGNLSVGMRVHVSGRLLSAGIAEVDQMRVLDSSPPPRSRPAAPVSPSESPAASDDLPDIELRGTVEAIDTKNGSFVVRVKDKIGTHTRTILLADNTDLSGMGVSGSDQFPVKPGDRVTVAGSLEPDKTVLAGILTRSRDVTVPATLTPRRAPVLVGQVSSTSNRYTSRDLKIRLAENDREIKIKVPRGIPIRRDGKAISVHDLSGTDTVRVTGVYDGNDFRASRIDVVPPAGESDAPSAPERRGCRHAYFFSIGSVNVIGTVRKSTR